MQKQCSDLRTTSLTDPLRIPQNPEGVKRFVPVEEVALGVKDLRTRSLTDPSNIPGIPAFWEMIRPVQKLAHSIKKERNFWFLSSCLLFINVLLHYTQTREDTSIRNGIECIVISKLPV